MFTDIVGYTAIMGRDEKQALAILEKNKKIHQTLLKHYNGKWLKEMGDGVLASFQTITDAVYCAGDILRQTRNQEDLNLRIGIHLGEVTIEGTELYGDGVNIASRIEGIAESGQLLVSETIYQNIRNKEGIHTSFQGEHALKNVNEPIKVYSVLVEEFPEILISKRYSLKKKIIFGAGAVVILFILFIIIPFRVNNSYRYNVNGVKELDKSIAVLPFSDLSPNKDQEYLGDGISDALINKLGTIGQLRVTSSTSSAQFKDSNKSIAEIASILNTTHVLEGSVLESGNNIRIAANLIDAKLNHTVWTFERVYELKDILELQREFTDSISTKIGLQLGREQNNMENMQEVNPEAYKLYLQGMKHMNNLASRFSYNLQKALEYFIEAIEIDPEFALAHAYAGRCYSAGGRLPSKNTTRLETWVLARQHAEKAIEIDDQSEVAYTVLAWIKIYFEWDWEGAEKAIQNAIQINPSSDMAYHHYTHLLMILGRFEEGLKTADRFRKINPLNRYYIAHEIMDLYMTGRYEQALERGREILASDPGSQAAQVQTADVLDYYGLYDEMLDMSLLPAHDKARALILNGNRSEGMKILNEILEDEKYINEMTVNIAGIYMALNDLDKAFEWLEKGSRNREFAFPDIRNDHRFKDVYADPRWIGMINKLNIAK